MNTITRTSSRLTSLTSCQRYLLYSTSAPIRCTRQLSSLRVRLDTRKLIIDSVTKPARFCLISSNVPGRVQIRHYAEERATRSHADSLEALRELEEQYDTTMNELQIAREETQENTVHAEEDRKAAHQEFEQFKIIYEQYMVGESLSQQGKDEVSKKYEQKLRDMENDLRKLDDEVSDHH